MRRPRERPEGASAGVFRPRFCGEWCASVASTPEPEKGGSEIAIVEDAVGEDEE